MCLDDRLRPCYLTCLRTLFIGDVHGCINELEALLAACAPCPSDRLVFVGDLVAKGPDSRAVVRLARARGALAVRGNHDHRVLDFRSPAARERAFRDRRGAHHAEVAGSLSAEDMAWLAAMPLWLELPDLEVLVVHGGIVPGRAPAEHDPHDLMNLRSITSEGRPSRRVEGGAPWASRHPGPRHVVFGHDAVRGLQRHPHATGLDTGCVYGGALTALALPGHEIHTVQARRAWAPRQ